MTEQEAIICPFCGAPYRGTIPYDVVDVKCSYCGGRILIPSHLSVVPRCLNHPDTIAVGLCSQCSRQFCRNCLHLKQLQGGRTYLCTGCLREKEVNSAWASIAMGGFILFIALMFLNSPAAFGAVLFLLFSLSFIGYGVYILQRPIESAAPSVTEIEKEKEDREAEGMLPEEVESLYWAVWREYVRTLGVNGPVFLERRIHDYMEQGMSKEEAIRRLAKNEKIF